MEETVKNQEVKQELKDEKLNAKIEIPKSDKEAEKLENLKKELENTKSTKQAILNEELWDIIEKENIKSKDIFYILSKIEWQGKEALGVMRINELMNMALSKTNKSNYVQLTSTEMNALYYLLLKVKSNSRADAKIYTESVYPLILLLEDKIVEAKEKFNIEIEPYINKIDEIEKALAEYEASKDKAVNKAAKAAKTTKKSKKNESAK